MHRTLVVEGSQSQAIALPNDVIHDPNIPPDIHPWISQTSTTTLQRDTQNAATKITSKRPLHPPTRRARHTSTTRVPYTLNIASPTPVLIFLHASSGNPLHNLPTRPLPTARPHPSHRHPLHLAPLPPPPHLSHQDRHILITHMPPHLHRSTPNPLTQLHPPLPISGEYVVAVQWRYLVTPHNLSARRPTLPPPRQPRCLETLKLL